MIKNIRLLQNQRLDVREMRKMRCLDKHVSISILSLFGTQDASSAQNTFWYQLFMYN